MSTSIPIGTITGMDYVFTDNEALAEVMEDLIIAGSKVHQIPISSLVLPCKTPGLTEFDSIAQALDEGTKFFDALLYFSIPEDSRPQPDDKGTPAPEEDRKFPVIARNLFYLSVYLLTRGNVPISDSLDAGPAIPAFLKNIYVMKISPNALCKSLGEFDIRNLDHSWIREVNWDNMSVLAKNRLSLGVAGYRMFAPFKMYPADAAVQGNIIINVAARNAAFATAYKIATRPYDWHIHPITRDPNLISKFGPLNPNLQNLMLASYTPATLQQMVALGMLIKVPVYNNRYTNFMSWKVDMIDWEVDPIFG